MCGTEPAGQATICACKQAPEAGAGLQVAPDLQVGSSYSPRCRENRRMLLSQLGSGVFAILLVEPSAGSFVPPSWEGGGLAWCVCRAAADRLARQDEQPRS